MIDFPAYIVEGHKLSKYDGVKITLGHPFSISSCIYPRTVSICKFIMVYITKWSSVYKKILKIFLSTSPIWSSDR